MNICKMYFTVRCSKYVCMCVSTYDLQLPTDRNSSCSGGSNTDFHSASDWFESSFSTDFTYPLTVGVEGYSCTSMTHTHTHNNRKDSSGRGIGQSQRSVPAQHTTLTANILALGGIRTIHPSKRAATDPRIRPSQLI